MGESRVERHMPEVAEALVGDRPTTLFHCNEAAALQCGEAAPGCPSAAATGEAGEFRRCRPPAAFAAKGREPFEQPSAPHVHFARLTIAYLHRPGDHSARSSLRHACRADRPWARGRAILTREIAGFFRRISTALRRLRFSYASCLARAQEEPLRR